MKFKARYDKEEGLVVSEVYYNQVSKRIEYFELKIEKKELKKMLRDILGDGAKKRVSKKRKWL